MANKLKTIILFLFIPTLLSACNKISDNPLPLEASSPPEISAEKSEETPASIPTPPPEPEDMEALVLNELKSIYYMDEIESRRDLLMNKPFDNLTDEEKYRLKIYDYCVQMYADNNRLWGILINPSPYLHFPYDQEIEIDLNGDHKPDKVIVTPYSGTHDRASEKKSVKVTINGLEWDSADYVSFGGNMADGFAVVDIDESDNFKEIVISNLGPSGFGTSIFLCYDGKQIIYMNAGANENDEEGLPFYTDEISGQYEYIEFHGNGEITVLQRAAFFQTWWFPLKYRLTDGHLLQVVPEEIFKVEDKKIALLEMPLYTERYENAPVIIMERGSLVTLTAHDNIEWIEVTLPDGQSGWFKSSGLIKIDGKHVFISDVFYLLNAAG